MLSIVCDSKYQLMKNAKGEDVYISPKAYYKQNKDKPIVDRMDECFIIDGIVEIDQMCLFANVRKSSGLRESYSLDAIANEELGEEKLDYTGYTIKDLAWKNFWKFVEYNQTDVLLLVLLEDKGLDMDMVQKISEVTNTRKEKVFKKTISLKNYVSKFAEMQGYVMGNNKNAEYGGSDETKLFARDYLNQKDVVEEDQNYKTLFAKKENFGA